VLVLFPSELPNSTKHKPTMTFKTIGSVSFFLLFVLAAVFFSLPDRVEAAADPCQYCQYCEFCSLCSDQCPCDHMKECQFCKYCPFCTLCRVCDTACAEGSFIRNAINWAGSWQDWVANMVGVQAPELSKVDQEISQVQNKINQKRAEKRTAAQSGHDHDEL